MADGQYDYDVIIVGSGVAGALVADKLRKYSNSHPGAKDIKVLILEAGGVAPDSVGRYELLGSYVESASKATDAPFCGDNILATQPDPRIPINGANYYFYPDGYAKSDPLNAPFKSFYERLVGGSTWHWQGIYVRMLPTDFMFNSVYRINETYKIRDCADWPISYNDVEPYYVQAELEMGVAGAQADKDDPRFVYDASHLTVHQRKQLGADRNGHVANFMSRAYPMKELVPSYLDKQIARAVAGHTLDARVDSSPVAMSREPVSLRVTPVPHAINSVFRDGRPACDGRTSCVPLCPIKARYEAAVHVDRAVSGGARLIKQAVVTELKLDNTQKLVTGVRYRQWTWDELKQQRRRVQGQDDETVTGRVVVLAANGIENPMILLRSANLAGNEAEIVGAYLMDHPIKQSFGLSREPLFPYRGPQTTSQIEGFRHGRFRTSYAAFKTSLKNDGWSSSSASWPRGNTPPAPAEGDWFPGSIVHLVQAGNAGKQLQEKLKDHAARQITLNSACEQLPIKSNRVSVAKAAPDDIEVARPMIAYQIHNDGGYVKRSFRKIIELHKAVFAALGVEHSKLQDDDSIFGGSGHIMGTTRMGNDPKNSVVDRDCRSHVYRNLFVLGSSVFPTSSTANPTSTVAALALRAADTILTELRRAG